MPWKVIYEVKFPVTYQTLQVDVCVRVSERQLEGESLMRCLRG
jgi:hypothetical protein